MDNSLFFCDFSDSDDTNALVDNLKEYSAENSKQMYLLRAPLGEGEADNRYDYEKAAVLLVPKHKLCFINFDDVKEDEFNDYCDDFIDDIGYLSDKYDYRPEIGRPRVWRTKLTLKKTKRDIDVVGVKGLLSEIKLKNQEDARSVDYLISLLIGSINDIHRIGGDFPNNILDQVKKKIVLFDGDQSRFIYSKLDKKRITIQGLAGTGKTELLLHKLRDLYTNKKNSKIVFTCYNRILAKSMKKRVPDFFNFMRVNEQIEWEKRLWVIPSWGSGRLPNTGLYSYICNEYGIPFRSFSYQYSFERACQEAIESIKEKDGFTPCFDYILIDESQDFTESFFELCELVTKEAVYIAGDIFQDIYDRNINNSVNSDFLLNKCYRTDPKTLMFAHSIGMGLYETPVIRWLEDNEWKSCGYNLQRENNKVKLSRVPLRRFEDVNTEEIENVEVIEANNNIPQRVFEIIDSIQIKHPTVSPGDIAIVFLEGRKNENYTLADMLAVSIRKRYEWGAIKGYETKDYSGNTVFISNRNNIKGLEFPFVICIANNKITDNIYLRNTLYMMLTRSFITSYLIINNDWLDSIDNSDFISIYKKAAVEIQEKGYIYVREPSEREKREQNGKLSIVAAKEKMSLQELVFSVLEQYPYLSDSSKKSISNSIIELRNQKEEEMTDDEIINSTQKLAKTFEELQ